LAFFHLAPTLFERVLILSQQQTPQWGRRHAGSIWMRRDSLLRDQEQHSASIGCSTIAINGATSQKTIRIIELPAR